MVCTDASLECAGFMTLQINEGASIPQGFTPAYDIVYGDAWEMRDAYEEAAQRTTPHQL